MKPAEVYPKAYDLTFLDGLTMTVYADSYSRAIVIGAYERLVEGSGTHKELTVESGKRRRDLDGKEGTA